MHIQWTNNSAIKRNKVGSFIEMWMDLESVIHREVSQEEKNKYCILMHVCLLTNLYAGQEATVRTGHGARDWFQIRKGVHQGCILLPCLFHFYAECIMRNAGLEEAQAEIRIAGRNINNLRYADDTTLMAESEKEVKSLLMKVKSDESNESESGEGKSWLLSQLNIQKTKIMSPDSSLHGK